MHICVTNYFLFTGLAIERMLAIGLGRSSLQDAIQGLGPVGDLVNHEFPVLYYLPRRHRRRRTDMKASA